MTCYMHKTELKDKSLTFSEQLNSLWKQVVQNFRSVRWIFFVFYD